MICHEVAGETRSCLDCRLKNVLDPLQIACQLLMAENDAVIYLLQHAHSHLDGTGGIVKIMFFEFFSAFNTIQPLLLSDKLLRMGGTTSTLLDLRQI